MKQEVKGLVLILGMAYGFLTVGCSNDEQTIQRSPDIKDAAVSVEDIDTKIQHNLSSNEHALEINESEQDKQELSDVEREMIEFFETSLGKSVLNISDEVADYEAAFSKAFQNELHYKSNTTQLNLRNNASNSADVLIYNQAYSELAQDGTIMPDWLHEIKRVLVPGGYFFIIHQEPSGDNKVGDKISPEKVSLSKDDIINEVLANGFEFVEASDLITNISSSDGSNQSEQRTFFKFRSQSLPSK
jgi:hypothetical protein